MRHPLTPMFVAALLAAAESSDVAAVVSDSVFPNFKELIRHHFYLFRSFTRQRWWWFPPLPAFPLVDEITYWSAWRARFKVNDFDLETAVRRINPRPILFVGLEGDRRMPPAYARALYADATSPEKQVVVLPGERHGEGFNLRIEPPGFELRRDEFGVFFVVRRAQMMRPGGQTF